MLAVTTLCMGAVSSASEAPHKFRVRSVVKIVAKTSSAETRLETRVVRSSPRIGGVLQSLASLDLSPASEGVRRRADRLATLLDSAVQFVCTERFRESATLADDGAVHFEYRSPNARVLFTVEPEEGESGWGVVTKREAGDVMASGSLGSASLRKVLLLVMPPKESIQLISSEGSGRQATLTLQAT